MSELFVPENQHDTIVIFAPGPSLSKEQIDYVMSRPVFTIAIGAAAFKNPFTDILYHCDAKWWRYYKGVPDFHGCHRVSLEDVPELPKIQHLIKSPQRTGIDLSPSTIVTGSNSGYQAISLALHYKPKTIILLGYDMKHDVYGNYNVIGQHPKEIAGPQFIRNQNKFKIFAEKIGQLVDPLAELGVTVYNCTSDTDLNCFPKRNLSDVLA